MKKQNTPFENIYDLFAIRIIFDVPPEREKAVCWQAYSIVTDMYQPNPNRLRDWISIPKSNGYESLHTTVIGPQGKWVEVQIRTTRMDEVAEKGLAAHWKYKGIQGETGMDEWLRSIREILENPELNAIDFMDEFKLNLYDKEVFVFTPGGDLHKLPKGRHGARFRLPHPLRAGMPVRGGEGQRTQRAHQAAAGQRRPGGDTHLAHAETQPLVAGHREHLQGQDQDTPGPEGGGIQGRGDWPRDAHAAVQELEGGPGRRQPVAHGQEIRLQDGERPLPGRGAWQTGPAHRARCLPGHRRQARGHRRRRDEKRGAVHRPRAGSDRRERGRAHHRSRPEARGLQAGQVLQPHLRR